MKRLVPCAALCAVLMFGGCAAEKDASVYPVDTDAELTYWAPLGDIVSQVCSNLGDTEFAQALEKQTGIKVRFIHSENDNMTEAFQVMIASHNLPDIIESNWQYYPGVAGRAVTDGYIISLDKLKEEYSPNLARVLSENRELLRQMKQEDGGVNYYPFLRLDDELLVTRGLVLRKDWLDELGLAVPETIDEWTEVLTAFRDAKGASAPISFEQSCRGFGEAYGVVNNYYIEDGSVKSRLLSPEYKQFLQKMHEWYENGLIAKNYSNLDTQAVGINMLTSKSGACFTHAGSGIGKWLENENRPEGFDLVGAKFPVLTHGDEPVLEYKDAKISWLGAAITTMCSDPQLAARLLDYGYSEAGHMLYNFGIEGESYVIKNGQPEFTDRVTNSPDGSYFANALARYARSSYSGPFVQDVRYIEQYYTHEQQKQAVSAWSEGRECDDGIAGIVLTSEEENEILALMTDTSEYSTQMYNSLIMGAASFGEYDKYINELKRLGVDRILEIYNDALTRQNKQETALKGDNRE